MDYGGGAGGVQVATGHGMSGCHFPYTTALCPRTTQLIPINNFYICLKKNPFPHKLNLNKKGKISSQHFNIPLYSIILQTYYYVNIGTKVISLALLFLVPG